MTSSLATRLLVTVGSALILAACGGGGGSPSAPPPVSPAPPTPPPAPPPAPVTVTLSGTLTYDRVPNVTSTNGLDYNAITQEPIRFAPVDLLSASNAVLATTTTDAAGAYSFSIDSGQSVRVRVRSEVQRSGANNIDMQIVDNTSSNAVYALQGSLSEVPRTNQTRNLNAGSGWGGSSYTTTRAAAPFALLDTIYGTMEDLIAVDPNVDFPTFDVLWSVNNRAESGDVAQGQIGTSSFTVANGIPVIRILGDADNDTDEYDAHVVVHEFGHYFENILSRADSIGGQHSTSSRLDARVAFGEGWGNALSGMILDDPIYRDSFGNAQAGGFSINVENNNYSTTGWFGSGSVQSILYDIFDANDDGPDSLTLGLGPIYQTFVSASYQDSDAFTSIFNFLNALEQQSSVTAADLTPLLSAQNINSLDPFGAGETNNGGLAAQLPVYIPIQTNGTAINFCSVDDFGIFNRHGNRRFFTFDLASTTTLNFNMTQTSGPTGADPDFNVFRQGQLFVRADSGVANTETDTATLAAGTYVVDAYDFRNLSEATSVDACFDFSIQ